MSEDMGAPQADGLSSASPMEPQASPPEASIPSAQERLGWPAPENGLSLAQLASWMNAVEEGRWNWTANSRCKYVTLRIDTRRGAFDIRDRDDWQIDGAALRWQYSKEQPLRPPALASAMSAREGQDAAERLGATPASAGPAGGRHPYPTRFQMTELSPELQSELIAFVRDYASDKQFIPTNGRAWEAWAKDIAAKLPPPVDPDIEEARKVAAEEQLLENTPNPLRAEQFLSGKFDAEPQIMLALKAIRRGRELERLSISVRHPSPVETAAALRELERSGI